MTVPVPQTDGRIPFLDLARTHAPLADVFAGEFEALLESSTFVNGEQVGTFEVEFAGYCGTRTASGWRAAWTRFGWRLPRPASKPGER